MSGSSRKLMGTTAAGGAEFLAVEEVFQSWLYTGNGSTQTITNGIDLAGEGGLVWTKARNEAFNNMLFDTERGGQWLATNLTNASTNISPSLSFNSDGYTLQTTDANWNNSAYNYASWTFRKAPRFFDVVTYTGDGTNGRAIPHNLGVVPGCIILKVTSTATDWYVFHRSLNGGTNPYVGNLRLNNTGSEEPDSFWVQNPTDTNFYVKSSVASNQSGQTYVAYLFAHDPLGPSEDGSDGLIACGSYTGNGSTDGPEIDLGWEPQWILVKRTDTTSRWGMYDVMRQMSVTNAAVLQADVSAAEFLFGAAPFTPTPTGFKNTYNFAAENASGGTYIYIAIRRGPMRVPESGTEVFATSLGNASATIPAYVSNFVVDLGIERAFAADSSWWWADRLRGTPALSSNNANAESASVAYVFDSNIGYTKGTSFGTSRRGWMFRRAPGFFDVVAYTGNGTAGRTVPHNLGVAPEMMIVKSRSTAFTGWTVYSLPLGNTYYITLNYDFAASGPDADVWSSSNPTETSFSVGNFNNTNGSSRTFIAYLFATLPGVSKVGSYTGNGSSQTIDCGFTSGARFILIKRTDSTGDWYVWDTARGIVTGNDPFLELNTTDAEVTSDDSIDPASSGFIVNQTATTNVNVSSASYIFYAVS